MADTTLVPWGLRFLTPPAKVHPAVPPKVRVEIDPVSQTASYLDDHGLALEMGKHGTSKGAASATMSGGDGQGGPAATSDDSCTDYHQD